MRNVSMIRRQKGVALAVALILLVLLTLLALSGIRLSTMELRMAANDELRVNAFEQAQSLVDASIRRFANTPVLAPGVVICARTIAGVCEGGDEVIITLRDDSNNDIFVDDLADQYVNVDIRRIDPQNAEPPVGTGFSLDRFDAAFLRVQGIYDKNTLGQGAAQVNEGIAVVFGSAGEITFETDSGSF